MQKGGLRRIISLLVTWVVGICIGISAMQLVFSFRHQDTATIDEPEELITEKIAIVNLDRGASVDNEEVRYAAALINDPADNFVFTGLEDARNGYDIGLYAGYIIIPATFSESVLSLNSSPVRAQITYEINPDLRKDVQEKVIYDIIGLISDLNNNVSYMYMSSIMDEFHDAQDETAAVMENDASEREAINAITANDLVTTTPVVPITIVERNVEPLNVSDYISRNIELTSEIGAKYRDYINSSEEDHKEISEEGMNLITEMTESDDTLTGLRIDQNDEGESVIQKGSEDLFELYENHNTALNEAESRIQTNYLEIYQNVYKYVTAFNSGQEFLLDNEGEILKDAEGNNIPIISLLNGYNHDVSKPDERSEVISDKLGEIDKLDMDNVNIILNNDIFTPIQDRIDSIRTTIIERHTAEREQIMTFDESIMNYDPLKYIDYDEIETLTSAMYDNGTDMSEAIYNNYMTYAGYADAVYESTRNDLSAMQENIVQAQEASDAAVAAGLKELKDVKNTNSMYNQAVMYDFSEKLPYTRLGNLEYRQAYEFMTDPIAAVTSDIQINISDDSVRSESDNVEVITDKYADTDVLVTLILTMICIMIVGFTIRYHIRNKQITYADAKGESAWLNN